MQHFKCSLFHLALCFITVLHRVAVPQTITGSQDKELVLECKSVYCFLHQKGENAMKKMSAELSVLVT